MAREESEMNVVEEDISGSSVFLSVRASCRISMAQNTFIRCVLNYQEQDGADDVSLGRALQPRQLL